MLYYVRLYQIKSAPRFVMRKGVENAIFNVVFQYK